jgi:asparagine synthase (glutamine-hydrolysing)
MSGLAGHRNLGVKLQKVAGVLDAADVGEMYQRLVSLWPDAARMVAGGTEPDNLVRRRADWPDLPDAAAQMMYLDAMTYLPDDILTKVDRASMAVSLEARVPLLDHRLVAFAWSLPPRLKIAGTVTKKLLRDVLGRHVPRALVERPKAGFSVPLDAWLRGPLRDWAEALLDEARLQRDGLLDPAPIRARWAEHLAGRRNHQEALWTVLMLQSWLETAQ